MKRLIPLLLLLTLAGCTPTAADYARDQRDAQRYELQAQQDRALADDWTQATRAAIWLGAALLAVGAGWAGAALILDARERALRVRAYAHAVEAGVLPTPDGRLPVPLGALPAASIVALTGLHGTAQTREAGVPLLHAATLPEPVLAGLLEAPPAD